MIWDRNSTAVADGEKTPFRPNCSEIADNSRATDHNIEVHDSAARAADLSDLDVGERGRAPFNSIVFSCRAVEWLTWSLDYAIV